MQKNFAQNRSEIQGNSVPVPHFTVVETKEERAGLIQSHRHRLRAICWAQTVGYQAGVWLVIHKGIKYSNILRYKRHLAQPRDGRVSRITERTKQ